MTLDRSDFDDVTDADLVALVANGVAEGYRLEFKRQPYGASDGDRREFLKDVTAFANASGGHLVIGIDASDGVASSLVPIPHAAGDAEILRMENLLRDGVEPRIGGVRTRAIQTADGVVLVTRVPRSWSQPHRVSLGRANRFYLRNSGGVHEASVEELRRLFAGGAAMIAQVRALRDERRRLLSQGEGPVLLADEGSCLLLHIVPLAALSERVEIDLAAVRGLQREFSPLGSDAFSTRFNFEGFLVHRHGDACFGYTQIFRNGVVEATKGRIALQCEGYARVIPGRQFCEHVIARLPQYLAALRKLDVPPPLVVMATLEGVRGSKLGMRADTIYEEEIIAPDVLELPPAVIENYGSDEDYRRALRPAFDALWNAGGHARCEYFDEDGGWR